MTPPSVLLDESFLIALLDPDHEESEVAHRRYAELLHRFEHRDLRLRSRHDHLERHGSLHRRTILAPVERVHVAGQHRRAAKRLDLPFEVDHDVAVTLVIMRRERIEQVASFHPIFQSLDVTLHR